MNVFSIKLHGLQCVSVASGYPLCILMYEYCQILIKRSFSRVSSPVLLQLLFCKSLFAYTHMFVFLRIFTSVNVLFVTSSIDLVL